ncbi:hypothetical protein [Blastopirellula retiformator]|uniref:HEAT repeat protein n=1 Tax=Blastopirellula retiformator TaxID=2527970 RepID=A0A5C5V745_9BACT|nr:hypothetical protein [Blastopirellula retiformator]TWT34346.1 hypothetical protein Enr8_17400 [Blastopirellula retiformator]
MDRRLALLLALLLPGCSGSNDAADTKPAATPVRVAKVEKKEPVAEEPTDPLDNFDPSKFSLGDGSSDPGEMPKAEMPAERETAPPAKPAAQQDLPPLVIEGAPKPPEPFSGDETAPGTPIPEEVQRVLNSYSDENNDAVMKLVLTYPQAEVRPKAAEKLDDIDEEWASEALLVARAALRDPDLTVRASAAGSICCRSY